MNNWFEVKIKYEKMHESGIVKMTTESYLVDAWSFTEAEARGNEELEPYMQGEFQLTAVGRKKYSELILDKGEYYYEAMVALITLDEKSGTEKNTNCRILVQADSVYNATESVEELMKKSMVAYRIKSVKETPIIDVFLAKEDR